MISSFSYMIPYFPVGIRQLITRQFCLSTSREIFYNTAKNQMLIFLLFFKNSLSSTHTDWFIVKDLRVRDVSWSVLCISV